MRYAGVEIADVFVLGYGLHSRDLYRNLPCVVVADRDVVRDEPEAYVAALYGRRDRSPASAGRAGRPGARVDQSERRRRDPMSLVGVRVEVPSNQPIVLLREDEGQRYLPIFIGPPEATAIVYALQGMETPRPMTHDLFKTVLDDLRCKLDQVDDHRAARRHVLRRDRARPRRRHVRGSRPAPPTPSPWRCATATDVPIFADEAVLDEAGVLFEGEDEEEEQIEQFREFLDQVRPEDFAQ